MRVRLRFIFAVSCVAAVLAAAAACGGSSSNKTIDNGGQIAKDTPSVSASAQANATPTPQPSAVSQFGVPPVLGGNVTAVAPGWAKSVKQAQTLKADPDKNTAVCGKINFDSPAQNIQWFRMAVDGTEVTTQATIAVLTDSSQTVKGSAICWAPKDGKGLSVGIHSAAISVQEPNATTAPVLQTVAWKFQVTP